MQAQAQRNFKTSTSPNSHVCGTVARGLVTTFKWCFESDNVLVLVHEYSRQKRLCLVGVTDSQGCALKIARRRHAAIRGHIMT